MVDTDGRDDGGVHVPEFKKVKTLSQEKKSSDKMSKKQAVDDLNPSQDVSYGIVPAQSQALPQYNEDELNMVLERKISRQDSRIQANMQIKDESVISRKNTMNQSDHLNRIQQTPSESQGTQKTLAQAPMARTKSKVDAITK